MKILALDTAGPRLGVCLWEDFRIRAAKMEDGIESHSLRLMPLMDELFRKAKWSPADLDGIAVDVGPGRFTGLRIGVAAARTLSNVLEKPVAEVTSLEALAAQGSGWDLRKPFVWKFVPELLCALDDARKDDVFIAAWRFHRPADRGRRGIPASRSFHTFGHHFKMVHAPSLFSFDRFLAFFSSCFQQQTILFAGPGAQKYKARLQKTFGARARFAPPAAGIDPSWVAALGSEKFFRREGKAYGQVQPHYLRPSYAEENAAKPSA
ncbi:MAG: tRNA (adenosine(37)-N6)-threonylcarbamoyltransferase complex dimerization subunit type 1 TsaB [Elusimicrobiota bacterium]